jgi:hypothetical protein
MNNSQLFKDPVPTPPETDTSYARKIVIDPRALPLTPPRRNPRRIPGLGWDDDVGPVERKFYEHLAADERRAGVR